MFDNNGCKSHDDDDDDYPVTPTVTSLTGETWRYDQGSRLTALISFTAQRFIVSVTEFGHNSYETAGSYSYDGDVIEFTYNETTYKVWCTNKTNETTLTGTKWKSKTIYKNGDSDTGTLEFLSDGSIYSNNFLSLRNYNNVFYSYDGQTIKFTKASEGTVSLQCGKILYEMAKNNVNVW